VPALVQRAAEAEWVEVHGLVRSCENRNQSMVLELEGEGQTFRAEVLNRDPHYQTLVGSRVRLRGVNTSRAHKWGQLVDILVPRFEGLRIESDPPGEPPPAEGRLLTTTRVVRELSRDEAAREHPVRLRGVVTLSEPEQGLLFVHDETGGIYVEAWRHIHRLKAGDRVEVHGTSAQGSFAPVVDHPRIKVLGHGPLPPARRVRPEELVSGQEDSQWIEVEGVVRSVKLDRWGVLIHLSAAGGRVPIAISRVRDEALPGRLVNAHLRVRGVPRSVLTVWNQLGDVVLGAPNLESLTILKAPPPAPFDLPIHPVKTLLQFAPGETWEHRVRVRGIVTYSQPGEIYVRDDTGGVAVRSDRLPNVEPGDAVDVIGFAVSGEYKPMLQDADLRNLGKGADPLPITITPEQALVGRFDGELVNLEGRLLDVVRGDGHQRLMMRAGPFLFPAILHGPTPHDLRPGSGLRLTGICAVSANEYHVAQAFRLLLRTPADIQVLHAAPWWTPQRTAWAFAGMAGVVGLAFAWIVTLRRRVLAQAADIWDRVRRETELQERQRMARELHDTLEQNLVGIGLCVEAANRAIPETSKVAERHLAQALEQVNAGIDEVRRSVWALRKESLDTKGLASALEEIGQQLSRSGDSPIDIRTQVEGGPRPFPVAVENNLLRIGQEALTNAVRHGHATQIKIELRYDTQAFQLRVTDDGRGFDADASSWPGHFGLLGMEERARMIGGQLSVRSTISRGTVVEVTVPLRPLSLPQAG
jgi:signal transduction histidine kinase